MSATMQSMGEACRGNGPELVHDPRFLTNPDRVLHRAELEAIVGAFFQSAYSSREPAYLERGITVGPSSGDIS